MSVSVSGSHCVVCPDSANVSVRLIVSLSVSVSGNHCLVWPDYANVSVCLIVSVSVSACNGNHCVVCPYSATVSVCLIVKVSVSVSGIVSSGLTQLTSVSAASLSVCLCQYIALCRLALLKQRLPTPCGCLCQWLCLALSVVVVSHAEAPYVSRVPVSVFGAYDIVWSQQITIVCRFESCLCLRE